MAAAYPLGDGMVLIGPRNDRLFILNNGGRLIWEARESGLDVVGIAQCLERRFGVSLTQARTDVTTILGQWEVEGLFTQSVLEQDDASVVLEPRSPIAGAAAPPRQWSAQRTYRLFDRPFLIRFEDAALEAALHPLFAHLIDEGPATLRTVFSVGRDAGLCLFRDGIFVGRYEDLGTLQLTVHREVGLLGCAGRDLLAVFHAGAVSDGESAIVLPAPGGYGKSTLTAALIANGLIYLGDDLIPVERGTGHVVPVPTCLNLKDGSLAPLRPLYPHIDRVAPIPRRAVRVHLTPPVGFRERLPTRSYPVCHLVFPQYRKGVQTTLQRLTPIEALERLMATNSLIEPPLDPQKIGELVAQLDTIPAWRLDFDGLDEACACVRGLFAT